MMIVEVPVGNRITRAEVIGTVGVSGIVYLMSKMPWFPDRPEEFKDNIIEIHFGTLLSAIDRFTRVALREGITEFHILSGTGDAYLVRIVGTKREF
jgi:hypothetical protein